MGYLSDQHIQTFCEGRTIVAIEQGRKGFFNFVFDNDEKLCLHLITVGKQKGGKGSLVFTATSEIIATPVRADGKVKQSTEIF